MSKTLKTMKPAAKRSDWKKSHRSKMETLRRKEIRSGKYHSSNLSDFKL